MGNLVRMDEYCSSVRDGTHDTPKPTEHGYYLVTSRAINNNSIDFRECYYISKKDYDQINKRSKVEKWDVLMTMIGTVGRLYIVKDIADYAIKNIALFKVGEEIKAKWLYYYLSNSTIQNYFELIASGTSQHFIGLGHLRKLKIACLCEQSKQIVTILSTYDELIEKNNRKIEILQEQAQEIYKEWFVRFRFPGHETAEFENGLPKGWTELSLKDFGVSLDSGARPAGGIDNSLETGMPSLGAESINGLGEFDYETVKLVPLEFYAKMKHGKNTGNDILIYKDGAYIGKTTIFMNDFPYPNYTVNEHVFLLNAIDKEYQFYLFFVLNQPEYYYLMQNLNRNAAQPGLSRQDINRIKIVVPNKVIVGKFNVFIKPILNLIFDYARQKYNLKKQRDLLLPRLMNGKLEVR